MDTITVLLIVIGVMLVYVVYLQIRLFSTSRPTYVVMPPVVMPAATEGRSGCAAPAVAILFILAALVFAMVNGLIPIG